MIELRDCIVGVKDVKEYEKVIQIAKEQGCEWNSGDSLDYIYCPFPGTLFFDKKGKVTSGPYYEKYCDYHCKDLMSKLQELIIIRQKGKLCVLHATGKTTLMNFLKLRNQVELQFLHPKRKQLARLKILSRIQTAQR